MLQDRPRVALHRAGGDWSIFRPNGVIYRTDVIRKHGPVPSFPGAEESHSKGVSVWRRRVFFSFDHDKDPWRANQIRDSHVVAGADLGGFFDLAEYQAARMKGAEAVKRMILRHLANSTATVVLIGSQTSLRPLVQYGIEESIKRQNGLGIRIHLLKDQFGRTSIPGRIPVVPAGIEFPVYDWDRDVDRFRKEIEATGRRADALRPLPQLNRKRTENSFR